MSDHSQNEIAIMAAGLVSPVGVGREAHAKIMHEGPAAGVAGDGCLGGALKEFNPIPYLSDRKVMKAISGTDAIGLVAIENLKKGLNAENAATPLGDPWRCGLYVGAPSAFASDNENYLGAVTASADYEGHVSMAKFGQECMSSRPNTLLIGLPNNVLCYGSVILGIQGPNSNYTSGEMSGVIALAAAARRLRRRQVDRAVAGAFTAQHERIISKVFDYYGVGNSKKVTTDSGAFVAMARAGDVAAECPQPVALLKGFGFGSSGISLDFTEERHLATECATQEAMIDATQCAIESALADAGVTTESVGLILAGSTGIPEVDQREFLVLSRVFAKGRTFPALGSLSAVMGNMMETGGLFEVVLGGELWQQRQIPEHLRPAIAGSGEPAGKFSVDLPDCENRVTLIVRTSPWGEAAAVVVRYQK